MCSNLLKAIVGIIIIIFISPECIEAQQLQQSLELWTANRCLGFANYTVSDSTVINVPLGFNNVSYVVNGLFSISFCQSSYCPQLQVVTGDASACGNINVINAFDTISITRYGDDRQSETKIHFFPEANLGGKPVVVDQNGMDSIEMTARSYFFTGANEWGVTTATGTEELCLQPRAIVETNGFGFTYAFFANLEVETVRKGCQSATTPVEETETTTSSTVTESSSSTTTEIPCPASGEMDAYFSCGGRNDGLHMDIYDCSKYIECKNGAIVTETECPSSMTFDPKSRTCQFNASCFLSCEGKQNGFYSHPSSCGHFIGCFENEPRVFKCPAPLEFDEEENKCNYPQLGKCSRN